MQSGWHVANWGFLGWLETGLKVTALVLGIIAFAQSDSAAPLLLLDNPRVLGVLFFALLTLLTLGQVVVRLTQREIISVIFAVAQVIGHFALLIALLRVPPTTRLAVAFGALYVAGEMVKQRFLTTTGYTESGATSTQMLTVSRGIMVVWIVFVVVMLVL